MRRRNLAGSLFLMLVTAAVHAQHSKADKIRLVENSLASWFRPDSSGWNLEQRMKDAGINGLSIAVIDNYRIHWVKSYGYADTAARTKVTDQTLFQSASIGKSIHGMACVHLEETGILSLDSPDINTYLKSWRLHYDTTTHGKTISLAQILSHSAGLGVHGFDGYKWGQPLPDLKQILGGMAPANNPPVKFISEPGLKFSYSGGGYEITELLIEDVTGKSYADFITNTIFRSLKMYNSTYELQPKKPVATAYRSDAKPIGCRYHLYPEKACGAGLWTTATDLAKFVINIQLSLKNYSRGLLGNRSARRMLTIQPNAGNYALGSFIEKKGTDTFFHHSGLNEGFSSTYFGSFEKGRGIVVLCNSDDIGFLDEIVNSVATVYGWKDFHQNITKKIVQLPRKSLDQYTGNYRFEGSADGPKIVRVGDELWLQAPGSSRRWRMHFTSDSSFYMIEARWAEQRFYRNEQGKITGFYILGDNYKGTVHKVE